MLFGSYDGMDEDVDLHESLRIYARLELGAPEDPWAKDSVKVREITKDSFQATLRFVLERSGWPVLKCGNGKGLKRCLMLDREDNLTWGSKKAADVHPTSVPLAKIKQVSRTTFEDGPRGASKKAMLIFNINDTHGLKILCQSEADALILFHGFPLLKSL